MSTDGRLMVYNFFGSPTTLQVFLAPLGTLPADAASSDRTATACPTTGTRSRARCNDAPGIDGAAGDPDGDGLSTLRSWRRYRIRAGIFDVPRRGRTGTFFRRGSRSPTPCDARRPRAAAIPEDRRHGPSHWLTVPALAGDDRRRPRPASCTTAAEFSTVVESDVPVVADRTMTWDATGYGSHAETGHRARRRRPGTWPKARPSGFDLFYLLQNPDDDGRQGAGDATCCRRRRRRSSRTTACRPNSRFNIWVDQSRIRGLGALAAPTSRRSSSHQRRADHRRARDVPRSPGQRSAPATRAPASPRRRPSGSWPKARPAPTSTCSS